jgi:hypothetical protein
MAIPAASAAAITSSSRIEPPGWMTAVARELQDEGTYGYGEGQIGQGELNALYSKAALR